MLYLWGEHSESALNGAMEKGLENVKSYDNREKLFEDLSKELKSGDVVLIKGSRGSKMDEVVDNLKSFFGCS